MKDDSCDALRYVQSGEAESVDIPSWTTIDWSFFPYGKEAIARKVAYHTLEEAIEILEGEGVISEELKAILLNNLSVLKP